jgi:hypothetical protein
LCIEQFAGVRDAGHLLGMRVAGILLAEAAEGRLEPVRGPRFEYISHCLGLMAQMRYAGKQG